MRPRWYIQKTDFHIVSGRTIRNTRPWNFLWFRCSHCATISINMRATVIAYPFYSETFLHNKKRHTHPIIRYQYPKPLFYSSSQPVNCMLRTRRNHGFRYQASNRFIRTTIQIPAHMKRGVKMVSGTEDMNWRSERIWLGIGLIATERNLRCVRGRLLLRKGRLWDYWDMIMSTSLSQAWKSMGRRINRWQSVVIWEISFSEDLRWRGSFSCLSASIKWKPFRYRTLLWTSDH